MEINNIVYDQLHDLYYFDYDGIRYVWDPEINNIEFMFDGKDKRIVNEDGTVSGFDRRHQRLLTFLERNLDIIKKEIEK